MLRINDIVSAVIRKPSGAKRAANRATRNIRTGSSMNAGETAASPATRYRVFRRKDRRAPRPRTGHRVDGQIAAGEILLERHLGSEFDDESAVAGRALALAARERVLLVRVGVQKYREVAADLAVSEPQQLLRECRPRRPNRAPSPASRASRPEPLRRPDTLAWVNNISITSRICALCALR